MCSAKITVRQGTHNAKKGVNHTLLTLHVSHRFNEIKQKTFEQFVVKKSATNYHKLPQITTNNPPTENTNLIHSNPIWHQL